MKKLLMLLAAAAFSSPAAADDPHPSSQCWSDGTCLSDSWTPVPLTKAAPPVTERAVQEGRPFYRPPVYYLPPPMVYTQSSPTPSVCYMLQNGIYSAIECPSVSTLPAAKGRHR